MENISIFDMLKIGVGPSSSHTLGPWVAAEKFIKELNSNNILNKVDNIRIDLYGSLSLTGKGHATNRAVALGLAGYLPETIVTQNISSIIKEIKNTDKLNLDKKRVINFRFNTDIIFNKEFLPFHSNGMKFTAFYKTQNNKRKYESYYYSIGGGFVIKEGEEIISTNNKLPYPIEKAEDLINYCNNNNKSIFEIVKENELFWRNENEIKKGISDIWDVMRSCVFDGCHTEGILPGGLNVTRRAPLLFKDLIGNSEYNNHKEWIKAIANKKSDNQTIFNWISTFAIAVNEVNASLGRVVTSPTNGSSGVIPAVIMYYITGVNKDATEKNIEQFLLTAGEIGSIFKKGATISAAMGGCQAEIGVSSAMAAAALTECLGGTPNQAVVAAEIAMEHHLGLTCDPIGGLVQIPCIERNAMGAIKAITAAHLALGNATKEPKVTLDDAVKTMWETALDMNTKYKETSEGGLARRISVNISEC
ncbi:MAG: L-serine ammonia-lyase [Ichthyobacteriaceae bacterium]|nr:L-serine ammonia-lyase [Ichthyobacteriaceae bacterium]